MKRYEWEDRLVEAQAAGLLSDGALLVALKLAKVINWSPKGKQQPGLYWKNQDAFDAVGIARATYFRHRPSLFETGFFTELNGNLIPLLPEQSQLETANTSNESHIETVTKGNESQLETDESQLETVQSQIETTESQIEHPFTVDVLSEDVCSEDSLSVDTDAIAPVDVEDSPNQREPSTTPTLSLVSERSEDQGDSSSIADGTSATDEEWSEKRQAVDEVRFQSWANKPRQAAVSIMQEDW